MSVYYYRADEAEDEGAEPVVHTYARAIGRPSAMVEMVAGLRDDTELVSEYGDRTTVGAMRDKYVGNIEHAPCRHD